MNNKTDRYNKITLHLRNPRNKAILERLAEEKGMSLSEFTAHVLENYYLPHVFKILINEQLSQEV